MHINWRVITYQVLQRADERSTKAALVQLLGIAQVYDFMDQLNIGNIMKSMYKVGLSNKNRDTLFVIMFIHPIFVYNVTNLHQW